MCWCHISGRRLCQECHQGPLSPPLLVPRLLARCILHAHIEILDGLESREAQPTIRPVATISQKKSQVRWGHDCAGRGRCTWVQGAGCRTGHGTSCLSQKHRGSLSMAPVCYLVSVSYLSQVWASPSALYSSKVILAEALNPWILPGL